MTEPEPERRRTRRYDIVDSFVEFSKAGLLSLFKRAGATNASIENLGPDGLRMRSPVELKVGKALSAKIVCPLVDQPLSALVKVVWCRRVPGRPWTGAATSSSSLNKARRGVFQVM